jgi:LacI family transcriptional regulator
MRASPTLHDVARLAGVTARTVSRVVNAEPHVSAKVRVAVNAAVAQLDYRPNLAARSLVSAKSNLIGVISPHRNDSYFNRLHSSLLRACRAQRYNMVIEQVEGDSPEAVANFGGFLRQIRPEAIVVLPGASSLTHVFEQIELARIKQVAISPMGTLYHDIAIFADEADGARLLAEHLWSLGHRSFAVFDFDAELQLERRSFQGRLQELGAEAGSIRAFAIDRRLPGVEAGRRAAIAMLETGFRPSALFAFNDECAAGAIGYMLSLGMKIPADISVVGFDDEDIARAIWPALTTVRQPIERMCEEAIKMLVGKQPENSPAKMTCPVDLIVRQSSGRAPD